MMIMMMMMLMMIMMMQMKMRMVSYLPPLKDSLKTLTSMKHLLANNYPSVQFVHKKSSI